MSSDDYDENGYSSDFDPSAQTYLFDVFLDKDTTIIQDMSHFMLINHD